MLFVHTAFNGHKLPTTTTIGGFAEEEEEERKGRKEKKEKKVGTILSISVEGGDEGHAPTPSFYDSTSCSA